MREIGLVLLLGLIVTALGWSAVRFHEAWVECAGVGGRLMKSGQSGWQNYRCVK